MNILETKLKSVLRGDVDTTEETLHSHSYDASLFGLRPTTVVFPKDVHDLEALVKLVNNEKGNSPNLSLTARAAGTDMTGGPLTDSVSVSFTKYMNHTWEVNNEEMFARVQPGVYYRDFEKVVLPTHLSLPCFPASKSLAALGGMVANNCAGERTLRYGKMNKYVDELKVVLSDGNEYVFKKLNATELEIKKNQNTFEGKIYRDMHALLLKNYDLLQRARPDVAKNSAGYALWDIFDKERGTFDLTQLFVGSQGTLGLWSEAKLRLVQEKPNKKLAVLFFSSWKEVPDVVNKILPLDPESIETFDDATLKLGLRFMPQIAKKAGSSFFAFALRFLPEVRIGIKMLGLPKLIMLVEFAEDTMEETDVKLIELEKAISPYKKVIMMSLHRQDDAEKYWTVRRESFSLLRKSLSHKRTAPFVEDFCVKPELIPEFLPKVFTILKKHGITATLAGHAGEGNFHIIPLMNLSKKSERDKIPLVLEKVNNLIFEYGGTMTAEHNDGLIRSPYLRKMYGEKVYHLFEKTKQIFDPHNIFNPGKKVFSNIDFAIAHIDHT